MHAISSLDVRHATRFPHPISELANRVHARAGFRLKNGRNGFILHRRFRRGLRARRKDGQLFVIPTGLVMRVGAT
jgi:hypothetical protein